MRDSKILNLYLKHRKSIRDISILDGRSESTIYKILLENNIELRDKSEANKIVPDKILIKLYNLGLSFSQIGTLMRINPTTVSKRFNSLGFPTRSSCLAKNIKYSDDEFKKYFCNKRFIDKIKLIES